MGRSRAVRAASAGVSGSAQAASPPNTALPPGGSTSPRRSTEFTPAADAAATGTPLATTAAHDAPPGRPPPRRAQPLPARRSSASWPIVSIALGIGANTAVFTLLDQVALRPLPVARPGGAGPAPRPRRGVLRRHVGQRHRAVVADVRRLPRQGAWLRRRRRPACSRSSTSARAASASAPTASWSRATTSRCSASSRRWAGCSPPATTARSAGIPLAVLGYDYWRRRFAGRADIIGQAISVNGQPFTVIGVAARGFYGLELGHAEPTCSCR